MTECVWVCSDVPGLFYCQDCDKLRQWNRFAQAYSYYVEEKVGQELNRFQKRLHLLADTSSNQGIEK